MHVYRKCRPVSRKCRMEDVYEVVNVNVLGRDYPVKCRGNEAEELRKVEKQLNRQLNQYRQKYVQLDKQDCLSMALIENVMESFSSQVESAEKQCIQRLDDLLEQLTPYLL